ncbi:MAG: THUMP domain-containing protein [Muribaculaceae bacterium]|nr:THUMP domain-containing protein [Muribaculaceae bacterium]
MFELVAKTLKGLEPVLADELQSLGASAVQSGIRMVSFEGDLAMMYRANVWCRTALCILKPIYKFTASDTDSLYELVKEYDWGSVLSLGKTFSIDSTVHSNVFTNSHYVMYRVKDAIVDWFKDRYGEKKRPNVCVSGEPDVKINVHIDGERVTISLNSSGESLHKRGWRVAQTDAPINEVLAAGILLKTGWKGYSPLVDPMCGSGTFLVEAAMIAANIAPGSYRKGWAFENWRDFDAEVLEQVLAEGTRNLDIPFKIYGSDISPKVVSIAEENIISAGVDDLISLRVRSLQQWENAPADGKAGVLVTNPPYGERLNQGDLDNLYKMLGQKLKHVFCGYSLWIISSNLECLDCIGLTPSLTEDMQNGGLDCQLREYITFEGKKEDFRRAGGVVKRERTDNPGRAIRKSDAQWRKEAAEKGMGGRRKDRGRDASPRDSQRKGPEKRSALSELYRPKKGGFARNEENRRRFKEETAKMSEAEEILARRRNEHALKGIGENPKMPSIPSSEGPFMRSRRRWKRPDNSDNNNTQE